MTPKASYVFVQSDRLICIRRPYDNNIFAKFFLANDVDPVDLQCDDEPTEWQ